MDTRTFLEAVLGDTGYTCVWAKRRTDKRIEQEFFDTVDDAIHAAHTLDNDGYDAYFALGRFKEVGSREAHNVLQMRTFFLDLDCGQEKFDNGEGYLTQSDALAALRTFCKTNKLPRPTLVNSGRGIHVYWPLTAPVSRETWVPVAKRFKDLCRASKLIIDPVVPANAAGVLRVPGTHNYKDDPPHTVHIVGSPAEPMTFEAFRDLIGAPEGEEDFPAQRKYTPREPDAMMTALSGSYTNRFKTILIKTLDGKGCAQIGEIVLNQPNVSEPMWRAGLSIAKFCVDGGQAIHKISEKHPEYTAAATEEKASHIKGPYLCERFNDYRPGVCPDCRHWNKIKSPIVLGREVEEAEESDNVVIAKPADVAQAAPIQYVVPKYPHPYFRGKNGGVFKHSTGNDGEEKDVMVYFNDLYVVRRLKDPELGEALVMRLHLPRDGIREFTMPLTAVGAKDEFRKFLATNGVAVIGVAELMEYTMRWVNELQFRAEATEARRQFGWTDEAGTSFVIGNMEIFKDRIEVNSPSSATAQLFPIFRTKGTLDGWKQTMEFYNRPGFEMHQFMFGLTFGSVLMEFQPLNAAAFHIYSKGSGLGKTTSMYAGASVWGDPDLLVMQERDTFNSKMNRAEVYKNIVAYLDEMTNSAPKDLSDWAYQLPSGLQRNRMSGKNNVERVRGKPWKTLFGSTGNTSMLARIALFKALPQAEAQRILEYQAQPIAFESKTETDIFSASIKQNFGHAGVVFVQYVLNNLDAVQELANTVQKKLDAAAGLAAPNRYWSALASRVIAGLMLAKKAELIRWEIAPIVKWIVEVMKEAKRSMRDMEMSVETLLTDYLAENYNNILRIKSTDDARKQTTGLDHLIHPEAVPRVAFVARYEYDIKKLYLLPKPLKTWCGKQQLDYDALVADLRTGRTKAERQKVRLGKGTHMNWPPTDALIVDCSSFMTDETEETMAANAALFQKQAGE